MHASPGDDVVRPLAVSLAIGVGKRINIEFQEESNSGWRSIRQLERSPVKAARTFKRTRKRCGGPLFQSHVHMSGSQSSWWKRPEASVAQNAVFCLGVLAKPCLHSMPAYEQGNEGHWASPSNSVFCKLQPRKSQEGRSLSLPGHATGGTRGVPLVALCCNLSSFFAKETSSLKQGKSVHARHIEASAKRRGAETVKLRSHCLPNTCGAAKFDALQSCPKPAALPRHTHSIECHWCGWQLGAIRRAQAAPGSGVSL